jgi:amyloid beta precursor protein binding protein 1
LVSHWRPEYVTYVLTYSLAQDITFPDSLVPLYIAFLAFDEFTATHDKDASGGALKVPGETDQDADTENVTGIAYKIIDDLVKEAGATIDEDDYSTAKTKTGEFVQEM